MASNTRCMPPVIAMLPVASLVPLEFACAPLGLQLESSLVLTATTTAGPQATYYIRHTVRGRVTPVYRYLALSGSPGPAEHG